MEGESSGIKMVSSSSSNTFVKNAAKSQESNNEEEFDAALDGYDSVGDRSPATSISGGEEEMDVTSDHHSQSKPLTFNSSADHIPISRHGMAVCEHCGSIGIRDAFYSKTKQYCSMACSRAVQSNTPPSSQGSASGDKRGCSVTVIKNSKVALSKPTTVSMAMENDASESCNGSSLDSSPRPDCSSSFKWENMSKKDLYAAPVSCFPHVAMADCWDNLIVGMKLEVQNYDYAPTDFFPKTYWIATVVRIAGYKALLRYEGYGQESSNDFWVNMCTELVYPVGWCASQSKPLMPPNSIQHKCDDWKDYLVKRLTGSRTLPTDFHQEVNKAIKGAQLRPGLQLEVVDKNRISVVRVVTIDHVIGGRIHVRYHGSDSTDEGFWCHERSPLIHPVGWAAMVGHSLRATTEYAKSSLQKALLQKHSENDASWDMFPKMGTMKCEDKFKVGMKLETIDPLNLSTICVATVMRVLRNDYLMIGIDGMMEENGADWFCYHSTSPTIFPAGFCELNNIVLTPPKGYVSKFNWFEYLKKTKSMAAPVHLFNREVTTCKFKVGMRLEAVDLMEPRLICVATVTNVIGRLLRIHFDGWDSNFDQWCDSESVDMYPVGWCESVGYPLEPPRSATNMVPGRRRKPKGMTYRGARRRKRNSTSTVKFPQVGGVKKLSALGASAQHNPLVPVKTNSIKVELPDEDEDEVIQMDTTLTFYPATTA